MRADFPVLILNSFLLRQCASGEPRLAEGLGPTECQEPDRSFETRESYRLILLSIGVHFWVTKESLNSP